MNPENGTPARGGGAFCKDDHAGHDIALIRRAVRERWDIPKESLASVAEEMVRISLKRTTTVGTMVGPVEVDNDRNQTAAARVVTAMVGQNQGDEHHASDAARDEARLRLQMLDSIPDTLLIEIAKQAGRLDLLPPRLQAVVDADSAGRG